MKVLHLSTGLSGGAGKAAWRIHKSLLDEGIDSRIVTLSAPSELIEDSTIQVLNRNMSERLLSSVVTFAQSQWIQNSEALVTPISLDFSNRIDQLVQSTDIIHLHNFYNLTSLGSLLRRTRETRIVATLHDQRLFTGGCHYAMECNQFAIDECRKCPQVRKAFQATIYRSFTNLTRSLSNYQNLDVVSPSKWLQSEAKASLVLGKARHHLIRNPASSTFLLSQSEQPAKVQDDEVHRRFAFVSMSLENPYKGLNILTEAIRSINNHEWLSTTEFYFIGRGSVTNLPRECRFKIMNVSMEKEMLRILKTVDCLVVPSTYDNFPNVIVEALLAGCDLITSDSGGVSELHSDIGHSVFKNGDVLDLAKHLERFTNKTGGRMSRIEYARKHFSTKKIAREYLEVYSSQGTSKA